MIILVDLFHGFFTGLLPPSEYRFNLVLLISVTQVFAEIFCFSVWYLVGNRNLALISIQLTGCCCMMAGSGCGNSRKRLQTNF